MNTSVTSKEAILSVSREIAIEKGLQFINMREVASRCGVALGSVYNYFPSKADLVSATIEDIWRSIFSMNRGFENHGGFVDCVMWFFQSAHEGTSEYPMFFTIHSLGFANSNKEKGRLVMNRYFEHIKNIFLSSLQNDTKVRKNAFNESFTQEMFVELIFSGLITSLLKREKSCDAIVEVIKRTIY